MRDLRPEPLIFPQGVRFCRPDELPKGLEGEESRIAEARLTTGYVVWDSEKDAFRAQFGANVHAPEIWDVFQDLVRALLPEIAAPIVGVKDDDPILGPYTDRDRALAAFAPFADSLQHDGLLEFGMIFQHRGRTEEVFVKAAKYLQIWTNEPELARAVLERHGIPEVPDLKFIHQYPRVSQTLSFGEIAGWSTVISLLQAAFDALPRR